MLRPRALRSPSRQLRAQPRDLGTQLGVVHDDRHGRAVLRAELGLGMAERAGLAGAQRARSSRTSRHAGSGSHATTLRRGCRPGPTTARPSAEARPLSMAEPVAAHGDARPCCREQGIKSTLGQIAE